MAITQDLPHWQLTSIFPGLESEAYTKAKDELHKAVDDLEHLMDASAIGQPKETAVDKSVAATFDAVLESFNALYTDFSDLRAYLRGFTTTDAFNDAAQAEYSGLNPLASRLGTLNKRFVAWLGGLDKEALFEHSETARDHRYFVERGVVNAEHLMGAEAEALASDLDPTGGGAWAKLHGDLTSRDTVQAALPGQSEREYTLSELKNLARDPDGAVRQAAYKAELELLEKNEVAYAAAMNSIKGQVNVLSERRGWASALDDALFDNNISRSSLEAMQLACREAFPDFRRYLKAKANVLGKDALAWYDLLAPVSVGTAQEYGWEETQEFVIEAFRTYSDELAEFAQHSFESQWCDVPPRKGKRGGAFCMGVPGRAESRILLNFGGTLDDIFTVAHELGHGYHNACKYRAGRTLLQGSTPMTLAETASIFCETIMVNSMLDQANEAEAVEILEQDLLGTTQLVVDIYSRFIFEQTVFEKRRERELSIGEFKGIMLDAQASTYGAGLNAEERHPLMWAQKGHYYSSGRSFYNFPYTFGYLFGLGLYAEYRRQPVGFQDRYRDLLASTGLADAATLAERFGIDIEDPDFWRGSLDVARGRIARYTELAEALA